MDKVHRQHGSIVLYEEKKDGEQYIRIAYADKPGRKRERLYKSIGLPAADFSRPLFSSHLH